MRLSSLSARLLLSVSVLLVVFFGLTILVLENAFRQSSERAVQDALDVRLIMLLSAAEVSDGGELTMAGELSEARFATPGSGLLGQITAGPDELLWRSPSAVGVFLPVTSLAAAGERRFERVQASTGEDMFTLSLGTVWDETGDGEVVYTFTVAESTGPFYAQVAQFRTQMFSWFAVLMALLLAGQALLLRWVLSPLRQVADEIGEIEAGDRPELSAGYPTELSGLTRNTNRLIRAERKRLARYRNTLGNLAHSLKTPLAVLRNTFASRKGDDEDTEVVQQQIDRMNDIVSYQLHRAAAAGGTTLGQDSLDVVEVVSAITDSLGKVYADKQVHYERSGDERVRYRGDKGDLMEMLGNVLDNAFKWCRGRVRVEVRRRDGDDARAGGFVFIAEDDGDGIPESHRESVLARGAREDQSVSGQGIGLAVVRELVELAEGRLELDSSRLGGARVSIVI